VAFISSGVSDTVVLNVIERFEALALVWTVKIKSHLDWTSSVSWGVLIVIITSILAWFVGVIILSKTWLEKFVKPIFTQLTISMETVVKLAWNQVNIGFTNFSSQVLLRMITPTNHARIEVMMTINTPQLTELVQSR
jgi:hypothetical protein